MLLQLSKIWPSPGHKVFSISSFIFSWQFLSLLRCQLNVKQFVKKNWRHSGDKSKVWEVSRKIKTIRRFHANKENKALFCWEKSNLLSNKTKLNLPKNILKRFLFSFLPGEFISLFKILWTISLANSSWCSLAKEKSSFIYLWSQILLSLRCNSLLYFSQHPLILISLVR